MTICSGKEGTNLYHNVAIEINKISALYTTNQTLLKTEYLCVPKLICWNLRVFGDCGGVLER